MLTLISIFTMFVLSIGGAYCAIVHLEKQYINEKISAKKITYVVLLIFGVIGAFLTYKVCQDAISYYAIAKLMITYIFVCMAAIYDFKTKTIPNYLSLSIVGFRIVVLILEFLFTDAAFSFLTSSIIGCISSVILLYIAAKLSKGGMGYGDVKLFGAIGFSLGFYAVFYILLLSLVICTICAIPLLIAKKKSMRGDLPFAPFIYLAYIIALVLSLY